MSTRHFNRFSFLAALNLAFFMPPLLALPATPTTTTLAVSSAGTPVSAVSAPVAVTITATVQASGTPVSPGQVKFCDLSINSQCAGAAYLGLSQVTTAGTATLVKRFGFGAHSIQAYFLGTHSYAKSQSAATPLNQRWKPGASFAHIATSSGSTTGSYDLTVNLTGLAGVAVPPAPAGTVLFLDTSNGNTEVASGTLAASGTPTLSAVSVFQPFTITSPIKLVVGDFNHDGFPDLAVLNQNNAVSVYLNGGLGNYSLASTVSLPPLGFSIPTDDALLTGDLNGDGNLDLVVELAGTMYVLLGNGDGTFETLTPVVAGFAPWAVADLNGDGIPDLVAISIDNGVFVRVEVGNGDGTFTDSTVYTPPDFVPQAVAIGDVNNDGIPDLVVPVSYDSSEQIGLLSFLGNGDGTFKLPELTPVDSADFETVEWQPSLADLNGDGDLDVVMASPTASGGALVLLGNGDGTFKTANAYGTSILNPFAVAVADLNSDGVPDIVLTNSVAHGTITVLQGVGDGTFTAGPILNVGSYPTYLALPDLNGDGKPDFVVLNAGPYDLYPPESLPERLSVFLNGWGQLSTLTVNNVTISGTGTHNIEAFFPGDTNYRQAVSATTPLTAAPPTSPIGANEKR